VKAIRAWSAGRLVVAAAVAILGIAVAIWLMVILLTPDDGRLDRAIGIVEAGLVVASLWALWAVARRQVSATVGLIVPIVTALTVAQPFGIRTEPASPDFADALPAVKASEQQIEIAGVPLIAFQVSRRKRIQFGGESGQPTHDLRVRSWVRPGLLTSATSVVGMCGLVSDPCWTPADSPSETGQDRGVTLAKSSSGWILRTSARDSSGRPLIRAWRLSWGVVSPLGALYWLILIVTVTAARWRRVSQRH
jgi:hypothetical protein